MNADTRAKRSRGGPAQLAPRKQRAGLRSIVDQRADRERRVVRENIRHCADIRWLIEDH